ncbi:exocyst subunit exo70 family protein H2 [Zostera marina]|uniref:Exocyst subunit Exo70 family protein n=1 Tax=Zostera marina TaxID=29655 RepID=A0A0K9PJ62_ZOSMR|nr:exocyst subunit exo70 family protein H2 [Zostera marina]
MLKETVGTAMKRLRREFYMILSGLSADEEQAMGDLREIAECMEKNGYGKECVEVYKSVRRLVVGASLRRHGFDAKKRTTTWLTSDWDSVEKKIISWMGFFRVAVKTIFSGERFRSDYIFNFSDALKESCFSKTIGDIAENFLAFPCIFAGAVKSMKINMVSPAVICRFLDLHSTLSDLLGDIKTIFSYTSTYAVQKKATASINIVGKLIRSLLSQFESSIMKNTLPSAMSVVASGGIHPVTRYVMNYVVSIGDCITALSDIYINYPPLPETFFQSTTTGNSNVSSRLAWILLILLCKLDQKSDLYKNPSLSYLFLSNNLQFVVQKVRGSMFRYLLGERWLLENEKKAMHYMEKYVTGAWKKVIVAALPKFPATVELEAGKKMIGDFNLAFEEACGAQSGWVVEDISMREKVKNMIRRNIVEPYRGFCDVWFSTGSVQMSYFPVDIGIFIDMVI